MSNAISNPIYEITVTLQDIEPPIWRKIHLHAETTLDELHEILQIVMGWEHMHLHAFRAGSKTFAQPSPDDSEEIEDEFDVRLDSIAKPGDTIIYEYDFGDGWMHDIKIERGFAEDPDAQYPCCVAGERACPPEDCGGPWRYPELISAIADPKHEEHEETLEWLGGSFNPEFFDKNEINEILLEDDEYEELDEIEPIDEKALSTLSESVLVDIIIELEDRTPRNLIDECANRGDAMLDALSTFANPNRDNEYMHVGYWWMRLHAVMIIGLMSGERAGSILFDFMRNMRDEEDVDLREWLSGYWPALFRNKPFTLASSVRDFCEDRTINCYFRAELLDCVLSLSMQQNPVELEKAIDWVAHIAEDEGEDWDMRMMSAMLLLDFPREKHKPLLENLMAQQSPEDFFFDSKDIFKAFNNNEDTPDWACFDNPWKFYDPDEIAQRQLRWAEEDSEEFLDDDDFPDVPYGRYIDQPYQRETPKIGRNDPCPCGSGKKYKKCCLIKELH